MRKKEVRGSFLGEKRDKSGFGCFLRREGFWARFVREKVKLVLFFKFFFVRGKRIWVQSGKEWDFVVFEGELGCKGFF